MAKLVDALPSGGSVRKDVQVRILFWAQSRFIIETAFLLCIVCKDLPRFATGLRVRSQSLINFSFYIFLCNIRQRNADIYAGSFVIHRINLKVTF